MDGGKILVMILNKRGRKPKAQCYECGPDILYRRREIRYRNKLPYCKDHLPVENKFEWPSCPDCSEELGPIDWNGSVEAAEIYCEHCTFRTLATNLLAPYMVYFSAAPVVES